MARRLAIAAWLGFALATLFFYPLAAALDANSYYLQWQRQDVAETISALALLTILFGAAVFGLWQRSTRMATVALLAVAALPLGSFAAGVARQLPWDDALRSAWESRAIRYPVPGAVLLAGVVAFIRFPQACNRWLRRLLILLSPISLVVVTAVAGSARLPPAVAAMDRVPRAAELQAAVCAPVLALLFDELSFSYLYDDGGSLRPEFPEIARFASTATTYTAVVAPGGDTRNAVPSLLAARHLRDVRIEGADILELRDDDTLVPLDVTGSDGLFATARRLGLSPEVAGYYLSYCDLLGDVVDACRSLSFYNASTPHDRFSPLSPVLTTFILWPRQFPFGLLKNPAFAMLQRELVAQSTMFAGRPLAAAPPVFRLVHFSIPHLPFVFTAQGYDPPLDPLRTSPDADYVAQLGYVDRLVGELLAPLRASGAYDEATIVLFADHGFRYGGRERDPLRIPFIVKTAGQSAGNTIDMPEAGEQLLKRVVEGSCRL